MSVRVWQHLFTPRPEVRSVASIAEIDLSRASRSPQARLHYARFAQRNPDALRGFVHSFARFGAQAPSQRSVLVVLPASGDSALQIRYPGACVDYRGVDLVSANAAEVTVIRRNAKALSHGTGGLTVDPGRVRDGELDLLGAIVDRLRAEDRIWYFPAGMRDFRSAAEPDGAVDIVLALNPHADRVGNHAEGADVVVNGGFFIWLEEELEDCASAAFDPVGLQVVDGRVLSPAIYERPAMVTDRVTFALESNQREYGMGLDRVTFTQVSIRDHLIGLGCGYRVGGEAYRGADVPVRFAVDPLESGYGAVVYTRIRSGTIQEFTPPGDRLELAICGTRVVGGRRAGGATSPTAASSCPFRGAAIRRSSTPPSVARTSRSPTT